MSYMQFLAFFQQTKTEQPFWFSIMPLLVFFGVLYFLVLRPQMKQQKDLRKMVSNLKKGDKVITSGGLWGEVDLVEDQKIRLKINDKTKVVVSRSAVTGMQPSGESVKSD